MSSSAVMPFLPARVASASGPLHIQPKSQYPPPAPLPPGFFDYDFSFPKFSELPLEIRRVIWKLSLPKPAVLHALGQVIYDPLQSRHIFTFEIVSFRSIYTNRMSHRALALSRVCQESREVYLQAFPISISVARPRNSDKNFTIDNTTFMGFVHISKQDRLCIANTAYIVRNPYLEEALSALDWTKAITTLYCEQGPSGDIIVTREKENTMNDPVWKLIKSFRNVQDLLLVVPMKTWRKRNWATQHRALAMLTSLRIHLVRVDWLHGCENRVPIFGIMDRNTMYSMGKKVLGGSNAFETQLA